MTTCTGSLTVSPDQVAAGANLINVAGATFDQVDPKSASAVVRIRTAAPTGSPTTVAPTGSPTTLAPTLAPTKNPTLTPTQQPTLNPTQQPTLNPTQQPTLNPTQQPTLNPTQQPTLNPTTMAPTARPTAAFVCNTPEGQRIVGLEQEVNQADFVFMGKLLGRSFIRAEGRWRLEFELVTAYRGVSPAQQTVTVESTTINCEFALFAGYMCLDDCETFYLVVGSSSQTTCTGATTAVPCGVLHPCDEEFLNLI